ncbi:hypothetical protein [Bowmanella denitrificans]|uniref:hypothetical protein n=1 Tax=Bowmanella denitrificans TaxID=366582 RepID=UPI0011AF3193|nr:hypothetical protein [Bowmanella denitrificans]
MIRCDVPLIPGAIVCGVPGLGIPGSQIPGDGEHGPSALYSAVSLPTDADAQFRALVTQWPENGSLFMYEDGSFVYVPIANDQSDSAVIERYKNGHLLDSQAIQLTVGSEPGEDEEHVFTGTASLALGAAASLQKQANLAGNMPLALNSQAQQSKQITFLGALPLQLGLNATLINPDQQGRYTARFDGLLHKPRFDGVLQ